MNEPTSCPACHASFLGKPIPEESREHFGNATHFLRVVAIIDPKRDHCTAWQCPDCLHTWPRNGR